MDYVTVAIMIGGGLVVGALLVCLGVWLGGRVFQAAQSGGSETLLRRPPDTEIASHTNEYVGEDDDEKPDDSELWRP